jgi:hypothetical protein
LIDIDDAGSGSLIGGTGIGIMRKETEEYVFKVIPPVFFQQPYFSQKKYQQYVIKIVNFSFYKLKVSRNEPIKVCRGYIFDDLRKWLDSEGYTWSNDKIEGALQYMVEESFNNYVIMLGLPRNFVQHARFAFGFHRLLKWVFADLNNRAKYCKSGWKSWIKWSKAPLQVYPKILEQDMYCLKCGKLISKYETASMLEYHTNRTWFVPLHTSCCSYSYTQDSSESNSIFTINS